MAKGMLSEIVGGSPIPIFVINRKHKVIQWNKALESISGISAHEMIGTTEQWRAFYTEKRPTMADLIVDGASANDVESYYSGKFKKSSLIDDAYEAEDFFLSLVGNGKWLRFTASPIKNEHGEIKGAVETLEDITEEKQLQKNMHLYVQLITRAQEEERKRIARELHDDMSPPLLLAIQCLDSITSRSSLKVSTPIKRSLKELRSLTVEALEGLRRCAQDLRPRILDDLGLIPALEWMTEMLTKNFGIDADVQIVGRECNLSDDMQLLLFRIAQEALSNVRRHSGASKTTVKLEFKNSSFRMTITDNGKGFELPNQTESLASVGKLGIIGMQERALFLGGNLEIQSEPGKGTQVTVTAPLLV